MNNKKVMPTNEIVGAILQTHANDTDLDKFKSTPSDFLQTQGIDTKMTEIAVVENESAMVHLCLPYYEGVENVGLDFVTDDDLASISGGEFGFAVTAIGLAIALPPFLILGAVAGGVGGAILEAEKNPK